MDKGFPVVFQLMASAFGGEKGLPILPEAKTSDPHLILVFYLERPA